MQTQIHKKLYIYHKIQAVILVMVLLFPLTGCEAFITKWIPEKAAEILPIESTFTVEGITFPTNPQTYADIREMVQTMVEEDIFAIEVPYRGDFMTQDLFRLGYQLAYDEAYNQVNSTHIEYTSNTSSYEIGYRVTPEGYHYIRLIRSDKEYTMEEILEQNAFFREEVERLVAELMIEGRLYGGQPLREQLEVLYQFVVEYLSYSSKITAISYTAYGAVAERETVCQGYVALFNSMAKKLGFEAEGVVGSVQGEGHIWSRVMVEGQWIYCDPTFGDRYAFQDGEDLPYNMKYFDMTEDAMIRDRETKRYGISDLVLVP